MEGEAPSLSLRSPERATILRGEQLCCKLHSMLLLFRCPHVDFAVSKAINVYSLFRHFFRNISIAKRKVNHTNA